MALIVQGNKTIAHAVVRVRIAKSLIITKLVGVYLDRAQANKEYRALMETNRGKRETYAIERTSVIQPGPALVDDVTGQPVAITIANGDQSVPPDPEELNDSRAAWAETAVEAFMAETGVEAGDAVPDLIADLHHLCDRQPDTYGTFDTALDRATIHYEAETEADGDAPMPVAEPVDHAAIVTAIHGVMDGQEWEADTLDRIASIFKNFGMELRDVNDDDDMDPHGGCKHCDRAIRQDMLTKVWLDCETDSANCEHNGGRPHEPETCDECGAPSIINALSLVHPGHAESCSLHPSASSDHPSNVAAEPDPLIGKRIETRVDDEDTDDEGKERKIPAGTKGWITSFNHTDTEGLKFYNVTWDNGGWTVWSTDEIQRDAIIVLEG